MILLIISPIFICLTTSYHVEWIYSRNGLQTIQKIKTPLAFCVIHHRKCFSCDLNLLSHFYGKFMNTKSYLTVRYHVTSSVDRKERNYSRRVCKSTNKIIPSLANARRRESCCTFH